MPRIVVNNFLSCFVKFSVFFPFLASLAGCQNPVTETEPNNQNKAVELAANLVVLPPLVLGYNDLYYDDQKLETTPSSSPSNFRRASAGTFIPHSGTTKHPANSARTTAHPADTEINIEVNPKSPQYARVQALLKELMDLSGLGVKPR